MIQLQLYLLKTTLQRLNKFRQNFMNLTADLFDKAELI